VTGPRLGPSNITESYDRGLCDDAALRWTRPSVTQSGRRGCPWSGQRARRGRPTRRRGRASNSAGPVAMERLVPLGGPQGLVVRQAVLSSARPLPPKSRPMFGTGTRPSRVLERRPYSPSLLDTVAVYPRQRGRKSRIVPRACRVLRCLQAPHILPPVAVRAA